MIAICVPLFGSVGVVGHALIDPCDEDQVFALRWYLREDGYAAANKPRSIARSGSFRMHRFILDAPADMEVDHINHDRLDNRRSNLRLCTKSQNHMNMRPTAGRELPKGVHPANCGKYKAVIKVNRRTICLGTHDSIEQASIARRAAELEHFGSFGYGMTKSLC